MAELSKIKVKVEVEKNAEKVLKTIQNLKRVRGNIAVLSMEDDKRFSKALDELESIFTVSSGE